MQRGAPHHGPSRTHFARTRASGGKAGLSLGVRLALGMSVAIALVMVIGGFSIFITSTGALLEELKVSGVGAARNLSAWPLEWSPDGPEQKRGDAILQHVRYKDGGVDRRGILFRHPRRDEEGRVISRSEILIPEERFERLKADLLLLVFSITVVLIAVASTVAWFLAKRITAPLTQLVADIDVLSKGDLDHKTRVREGGEVGMLAMAVDRMAAGLKDAKETELELQKREHDLAVASEVRESLLPSKIVQVEGYEIAGTHKACEEVGGDYYDVVPIEGSNRIAILVAEVAGKGVSAALVMTMARAYLRSELQRHEEPAEAFAAANRALTRDMRRGMFVTVLCALLEPETGSLRVVSAGHKVPLIHWVGGSHQLKAVTPPGIALGFDPGPVFERTLKGVKVNLAPGDRVILSTSGILGVKNPSGRELGEKGFYSLVKKELVNPRGVFLDQFLAGLEHFRDGGLQPADIAIATLSRT